MYLIDRNGNNVGHVSYNDGEHILVGDIVKDKKLYKVVRRVWEASVGEITTLLVEEVKNPDALYNKD